MLPAREELGFIHRWVRVLALSHTGSAQDGTQGTEEPPSVERNPKKREQPRPNLSGGWTHGNRKRQSWNPCMSLLPSTTELPTD